MNVSESDFQHAVRHAHCPAPMKASFRSCSVLQALPLACVLFASACELAEEPVTTTMTDDEIRGRRTCPGVRLADRRGPLSRTGPRRCHRGGRSRTPRRPGSARPSCAAPTRSPARGARRRSIAIVDAFGYPNAESDLGDLPLARSACRRARPPTAASGRSTRPAARRFPRTDTGWAQEIGARPRHGERDVPELQDPARRGDQRHRSRTSPPR